MQGRKTESAEGNQTEVSHRLILPQFWVAAVTTSFSKGLTGGSLPVSSTLTTEPLGSNEKMSV